MLTNNKGIIYYTDNRLDPEIMELCQKQLWTIGLPIVSVSLSPINLGDNLVLPFRRGHLTMFRQILLALQTHDADIIYFCEHDVLYHPSHFEFDPLTEDTFYYNRNNWKLDWHTGKILYYNCEQTLGLCGYRELLLEHYEERVRRVYEEGYSSSMGFEPGKHRPPNGIDNNPWAWWSSQYPNVDIRHGNNLTKSRWSKEEFRSNRSCTNWTEADKIPFWGTKEDIVNGRVEQNS